MMLHGQLGPAATALFSEQILPAFDGQLNLRVAYNWNRDTIINFLCSVAMSPMHFHAPPEYSAELADICREIRELSQPAGSEYRSPDARLDPPQHILREFNWRWNIQHGRGTSKFKLKRHKHDHIPYWSPTDLLGLFISTASTAPHGATKRNFYLPLTAMYGQWCNRLLETVHKPSMFSCFWVPSTDEFFLGASLGGCVFKNNLVGSWPLPVKRARYSLVGGEPVSLFGWSFGKKPEKYQTIGNCAETYPILHLLRGLDEGNRNVHGLSLQKKALKAAQYQDTLSGNFWTRIADPRANCQFLIGLHGGDLENFCRFAGSSGAPA